MVSNPNAAPTQKTTLLPQNFKDILGCPALWLYGHISIGRNEGGNENKNNQWKGIRKQQASLKNSLASRGG